MESSSLLDISTLGTDSTLGDGSLLTLVDDGDDDKTNGVKDDFEGLLDVSFEERLSSRTMILCVNDPISSRTLLMLLLILVLRVLNAENRF